VLVDDVIGRYLAGGADYVSNTLERTYPRGLDVEVFSTAALITAAGEARTPSQREHVTPYLFANPQRFRIAQVRQKDDLSGERWTVDAPEDLELVRRILESLYDNALAETVNGLHRGCRSGRHRLRAANGARSRRQRYHRAAVHGQLPRSATES
jgi:spore coat polysaccharide biosynthesis protein SpsF (cytidylyltransferase family)